MCFYSTEEDGDLFCFVFDVEHPHHGKVFTTAIGQGGTLGGKLIDAFTIEPLGVGSDDDDDRMVDEVADADSNSINGRFHHHPYSHIFRAMLVLAVLCAWLSLSQVFL